MDRKKTFIILIALLATGVAFRLIGIDKSGPTTFPSGLYSDAPLKDESAKGFAARSRVIFGDWSPSPLDDYRFWQYLSPVWTYSQYAWFEVFGAGYRQARLFSVLWSAFSMLFLYLSLVGGDGKGRAPAKGERHLSGGGRAGLLAALFFAVNYYTLMFGRMGLLETQMHAFLILAFYFQTLALKKPGFLIAAAAAWFCAWFVKQSAVVYLPVLLAGPLLISLPREEGRSRDLKWTAAAAILVALALAGLFLWPDYRIRSVMNLRHTMNYMPDGSYLWMRAEAGTTLDAIRYNLGLGFVQGYLAMFPVTGPLALFETLMVVVALARGRRPHPLLVLAALWWICARAALTLQGQAFPRFYLIQAPPVMILAAVSLARLLEGARRRRPARAAFAGALALMAVINLVPWATWVAGDHEEVMRANRWLEREIGFSEATVVGEWANPFVFDTGYKAYYLKSVFNRRLEQVAAISPTHLVVAAGKEDGGEMDPAVRRVRKYFPTVWERRREVSRAVFWAGSKDEAEIILYRLDFGEAVR